MARTNESYQALLTTLQTATHFLEASHPLCHDLQILQAPSSPNFRIAIFAPFNYGKSTLLNALLGDRTLPMDLIPTTGAAIQIQPGEALKTRIQLASGQIIEELGTDILKHYAILDEQRQMRRDVVKVEVLSPHPLLQAGIEFLDLPGTEDQVSQNTLVQSRLLTADLIVQVLDARKLMTLVEREHIRDWLQDRGITTVVFVVNFLNLIETPTEQEQILRRLRFVAESFRSQLPSGVSNLFRVDALPALRAQLQGDQAALQASGLPIFESALQTIQQRSQRESAHRGKHHRLVALAQALKQELHNQAEQLQVEIQQYDEKRLKAANIKRKAQDLLKQGYRTSLLNLQDWLNITTLLTRYQLEAAQALKELQFETWEQDSLASEWEVRKRDLEQWIRKAADFFEISHPKPIHITFPEAPQIIQTRKPTPPGSSEESALVATGLGFILGGPVGAAVLGGASYLLNRNRPDSSETTEIKASDSIQEAAMDAAKDYLTRFSAIATSALHWYETMADKILDHPIQKTSIGATPQEQKLGQIESILDQITLQLLDLNA